MSSLSSSIKFALVGCGGIARHHLKALQECATTTQVAAVVDTRRENAEELIQLIPNECKVRWAGLGYKVSPTPIGGSLAGIL